MLALTSTWTLRGGRFVVCAALAFGCTSCVQYGAQFPEEIDTDNGSEAGDASSDTGGTNSLVLVTGGNQFGECTGSCRYEITFQPAILQLAVTDYGASQEFGLNYGVLTQLGQDELAAIDAELSGAGLGDIYGCPDCDDGGASWVRISNPAGFTDHAYETGNPPPELVNYDTFLQSMISSLRTCSQSEYIVPDGACVVVN